VLVNGLTEVAQAEVEAEVVTLKTTTHMLQPRAQCRCLARASHCCRPWWSSVVEWWLPIDPPKLAQFS